MRQIIQNDYIALLIVEIGSKRCFVKDGNNMAETIIQIIIARSIKITLGFLNLIHFSFIHS